MKTRKIAGRLDPCYYYIHCDYRFIVIIKKIFQCNNCLQNVYAKKKTSDCHVHPQLKRIR